MKKIRNKTSTKQFPRGKPSVQFSADWLEYKIRGLEADYDKLAKQYKWYVDNDVALTNIHVLDTLRGLTFLYTDIAAHRHALRSLKTEF